MTGSILHVVLHLTVPGAVAWGFFRRCWVKAWLVMTLTLVVDLDHLWATPIYQPDRCSLGFHPLHGAWAIACYAVLAAVPRLRLLGLGLLLHMALDGIDCLRMA